MLQVSLYVPRWVWLLLYVLLQTGICSDDFHSLPSHHNTGDLLGFGESGLNFPDVNTTTVLLQEILMEYDTRIRPRMNQSQTIVVNVTFTPNSIVSLDTTEQKLDVLGFFSVVWHDELLHWDPVLFSGLNTLKLPLNDVWRPKLVILKAVGQNNWIGDEKLDVVHIISSSAVSHATVAWVPESLYSVLCDLDVTYYPFDIQVCQLQFYVADQTSDSVYLNPMAEVNLDQYTDNTEWKTISIQTQTNVQYGSNIISITIKVERRAQFTLFTMVLPLLMLSVLNLCGFLVPIDSGEKISLMVTLFLTVFFFVLTMRDGMPHNSLHVPYFLIYLMQICVISVMSVIYTVVEARIVLSVGDQIFRLPDIIECQARMRQSKASPRQKVKSTKARTVSVMPASSPSQSFDTRADDTKQEHMTWDEALHQLDRLVFFLLTGCLVVFTIFFFATVMIR